MEDFEKLNSCKCFKCILREKVFNDTIEYWQKEYPNKKLSTCLPFLRFRLYSPNLSIGQALSAFSFDDEKDN